MMTRQRTWDWLVSYCAAFAAKHAGQFEGLVPVSRGGLVPATLLSHNLGLPIVGMIRAASYAEGETQPGPVAITFPDNVGRGFYSRLLIVEDIIATGATVDAIGQHEKFKHCAIYTLIDKSGRTWPEDRRIYAGQTYPEDGVWVTMPWEQPHASSK